jgi:hypothetical protein
MNNTLAIETSIHTPGLRRRIRAALAGLASIGRRELTREELVQLHEHRLMAERLVDDARRSVYAARLM